MLKEGREESSAQPRESESAAKEGG